MVSSDWLAGTARKYLQDMDASIGLAVSNLNAKGQTISCVKGCAWCCYLPVRATLPEGVLAARHVRDTLKPGDVGPLIIKMEEWLEMREGPGTSSARFGGPACPFLRDGLCIIYPVRPMGCRVHSSTADPRLCGPDRRDFSLFASPGTVHEILDAVKPLCMEYRVRLERAGMHFESIVKLLPELVLGELKRADRPV